MQESVQTNRCTSGLAPVQTNCSSILRRPVLVCYDQEIALAARQKQSISTQAQQYMHAEPKAHNIFVAKLVRGHTCRSAPDVEAGAELAPSMADDASGGNSVCCIAAFCCFLAFFFWLLLICNIHSQLKKGHLLYCIAVTYIKFDTVGCSQQMQACVGQTTYGYIMSHCESQLLNEQCQSLVA